MTFTPSSTTHRIVLRPSSSLRRITLSRLCTEPDAVMPIVSGPSVTVNTGVVSSAASPPPNSHTDSTAAASAVTRIQNHFFLIILLHPQKK